MGFAAVQEIGLSTEECCNCSVVFALPTTMMTRLRKDGGSFYCPNGHCQSYTETENMRLRRKLDEQTRIATREASRAASAEAERDKVKKTVTGLKKRIKKGEREWKPPVVAATP